MSHLGHRLSALVDGELDDAERDQAHAHLVGCDDCRAEAAALRALKRRVGSLGETPADGALTRRLIALEGLVPLDDHTRPRRPGGTRARAAFAAFSGAGPGPQPPVWDDVPGWPGDPAPTSAGSALAPHAAGRGRGHTRYFVAGAVAALAVGFGAASFAAGGGEPLRGPVVTPEVDVYNAQHAATTGELPLFSPWAGRQVTTAPRQTALPQP